MKFIILFLTVLISSCSSMKVEEQYSICVQDGKSRLEIQEEFAQSFSIDVNSIDSYQLFKKTISIRKTDSVRNASTNLENDIMNVLAQTVLIKMKMSFGPQVQEYYDYKKLTIPVKFRSFLKKGSEKSELTGIAIVKKSDLTARSLIKYLPLEYKMKIIDKKYEYKTPGDPMQDF